VLDNPIVVLILIVAAWRASSLLVYETGPFGFFSWLRDRVGVKYNEFSLPYGTWFLPKVFACIDCMSVWVGIGFATAYYFIPDVILVLSLGLCLSMTSIVIDRLF
jgi:hypothetical protein